MKKKVTRTKFCGICSKPLRGDAEILLCREHGKKIRIKKWLEKNSGYNKNRSSEYRENNLEKMREYDRIRSKRPERIAQHRKLEQKMLKEKPNFRLAKYLRNTVYVAVKNNKEFPKAIEFLGCSVHSYRVYLESKFEHGMTWDNYGDWHIDHIRPLFTFNLERKDEFLSAAHFSNTQPLWAKDNLEKRNIDVRRVK